MRNRSSVYFATLFLSLSYASIIYINSSYLFKFFPPVRVYLLFVLTAVVSILLFLKLPAILRGIGNRKAFTLLLLMQTVGLTGLITAASPQCVALAFIIYGTATLCCFYSLDIFIEDISKEARTGEVRGIVLTFENIAVAASPLILSVLAFDGQFKLVYLASMLLLLPVFCLSLFSFHKFKDSQARHSSKLPWSVWWREKEIRKATLARLLLEIFYTSMTIFMPLYLSKVVGFSWHEIGIIFSSMLLAFVFFELPAGEMADKLRSEKGIMTIGFILLSTATLLTAFLGASVLEWIIVLFVSRIGAAFVEITSEAHFFRHVTKADTGLISIFRLTRPTSIIIGTILGAFVLSASSYQALFIILGLVLFLGLSESQILKRTH